MIGINDPNDPVELLNLDNLLEIFSRVNNPNDPNELFRLILGRAESQLPVKTRSIYREEWVSKRNVRNFNLEDLYRSKALITSLKILFNHYFSNDLYGRFRSETNVILSSGSVQDSKFRLPRSLETKVEYSLKRAWYGYSDSLGRLATRNAIAAYENARLKSKQYDARSVALTLGGTQSISALADYLGLTLPKNKTSVLCAIPGYPPLLKSISDRFEVELVPLNFHEKGVLEPLINRIHSETAFVLLQTVVNPLGFRIPEEDILDFLRRVPKNVLVLLDECHECFESDDSALSNARTQDNVIRIRSLSKQFFVPGFKVGWILASSAFIDGYYEYASSHYGGPGSFFYLVTEFLARFESWRLNDETMLIDSHERQFEGEYGFDLRRLQNEYEGYLADRDSMEKGIISIRDETVAMLRLVGIPTYAPKGSFNILSKIPIAKDSYSIFRSLLQETGVAVYPGMLSYIANPGFIRLTPTLDSDIVYKSIKKIGEAVSKGVL
jgi:aspartate/methionine/tyrosine aminotransferase